MSDMITKSNPLHPHERGGRDEKPILDKDGRCLVCSRDYADSLTSELAACRAERDEMRTVFGWNEGDKFVKGDGEGNYFLDRNGHDRIRCTIGRELYDEMRAEIATLRASLSAAVGLLRKLPNAWIIDNGWNSKTLRALIHEYAEFTAGTSTHDTAQAQGSANVG